MSLAPLVMPFSGVYYSEKNRKKIADLALSDFDSFRSIWISKENNLSFRNLLLGDPAQRGELFQAWLSIGEIEQAQRKSFYILKQTFFVKNKKHIRWALFAAIPQEHSNLFLCQAGSADGIEMARQSIECCEGDLHPVMAACEEGAGTRLRLLLPQLVSGHQPLLSYTENATEHSAEHCLWELSQPDKIKSIGLLFENEKIFLLDGHQRLAAVKENSKRGLGDGRILACISTMSPEDISIQAVHRVVYYEPWMMPEKIFADFSALGCKWVEYPQVTPRHIESFVQSLPYSGAILFSTFSNKAWGLQLPRMQLPVEQIDLMMEKFFPKAKVLTAWSVGDVFEQLATDKAQLGIFFAPLKLDYIQRVALAKSKLPRKAVRFMPKTALGLIARPWDSC